MWDTLTWIARKTTGFIISTSQAMCQAGLPYLRPLTTIATVITAEMLWHRTIAPIIEDNSWLEEHDTIKQSLPFLYYGAFFSFYCTLQPQHIRSLIQGITQHFHISAYQKAYKQFSDPLLHISQQTICYVLVPACIWHFTVRPTLQWLIPEEHPMPLKVIHGAFWIIWQRPTRILFNIGFNEYYHTAIATGLYRQASKEPVTTTPITQTEIFKELAPLIPIPTVQLIYYFSKSKPILKTQKTTTNLKNIKAGSNPYAMILMLVKRLIGYGLLVSTTEATPYLNYLFSGLSLCLKGLTLGYMHADIVLTNSQLEYLYVIMLAYLYSYSTHEYYFSMKNYPAAQQAIIMAENPAFHLGYGLPPALIEYWFGIKGRGGLDSEIIYGLLFCYFPLMLIQAQSSAQTQHQHSQKQNHWSYYLLPYYLPFYGAGVLVSKTLQHLAHQMQMGIQRTMEIPPSQPALLIHSEKIQEKDTQPTIKPSLKLS